MTLYIGPVLFILIIQYYMTISINSLLITFILSSFCFHSNSAENVNIQVSSTLSPTCNVSMASISFGQISSANQTIDQTQNLSLKCSRELQYEIIFGSSSGTPSTFQMSGADPTNTDKINYNIQISNGDGNTYTDRLVSFGNGTNQNITFKAVIAPNQYVKPDSYSDTITITLNY